MKHFQKYILFILLAAVPAQFLGTEQSKETLLKKFKEKSLAVGKIGLGGGGVIVSSFLMVALLAKPFVDLANLRNKRNKHSCKYKNRSNIRFCCCGELHIGDYCPKQTSNAAKTIVQLMEGSIAMVKENYKKLNGAQDSVELAISTK